MGFVPLNPSYALQRAIKVDVRDMNKAKGWQGALLPFARLFAATTTGERSYVSFGPAGSVRPYMTGAH